MKRLVQLGGPSTGAIALCAVLVYAAAFIYLYTFQFLSGFLPGPDGYYHIKAAWLMRTGGVLDLFPWAEASLWRDSWFNKDFGFHVLLIPFTFGDLLRGAKLAAVTYCAGVFVSFFLVLRLSRVRMSVLWTLVLISAGGYIGYRLNTPRPHLISIILALWVMFFILRDSWKPVAVLCAVYALCYTAPHVAFGYALVFWFLTGLVEKKWHPRIPLAALGGIGVGWLLHPNFPNNLFGWWVQNATTLTNTWTKEKLNLGLAAELQPADTRSFLVEHGVVYAALLGAIWLWPRIRNRLEPRLLTLIVMANGYLVLALMSKRFVEYFVPFCLWVAAEIWSRGFPPWKDLSRPLRAAFVIVAVLVIGAGAARTARQNHKNFQSFRFDGIAVAAGWLHDNTPRDSLVFTCDWDDTPALFFYNHRNRYLVFLDPTFMYRWRPTLWQAWKNVGHGRDPKPVETIRDGFGAKAGYCTGEYSGLRAQLERDPRVTLSGTPGGVFVFAFKDPEIGKPGQGGQDVNRDGIDHQN